MGMVMKTLKISKIPNGKAQYKGFIYHATGSILVLCG